MKKSPVWPLIFVLVVATLVVWLPPDPSWAKQMPTTLFQSGVPTPTPTSGLPPGCQDVLVNGGFETNTGWYFPVTAFSAGYSTTIVHSGTRSLRAGVVNPPDVYSYSDGDQKVTIPSGTQSAILSFWWYPISAEPPLAAAEKLPSNEILQALADHALPPNWLNGDRQYVLLLDAYGNIISQLMWTRSNAQVWQPVSLSLPTSVAGRSVTIVFGVVNDGNGRSTAMYIDDASLVTCPTKQPTPTPAPVVTPSPTPVNQLGARLFISSTNPVAVVGQVFPVSIIADTGLGTADTVDAYLNFDPNALMVVDAAGNQVNAIQPDPSAFPSVTINAVDPSLGQINYSATNFTSNVSGTNIVATIFFRAKTTVTGAPLTWVRSGTRISDLLLAGASLDPSLTGGNITIVGAFTLLGRVALERRGAPGDPRWVTPLFRTEFGTTTPGVLVYAPGTGTLVAAYTATTDASGAFAVSLTGLPAGTYDMVVKAGNTLANLRPRVTIPSPSEINFGTLRVGDSNGDDAVNGGDVSYMIPSFLRARGDPAFLPYADTNEDGAINGADVSALVPNFLLVGPITVTAAATNQALPAAPTAGAALSLAPSVLRANMGDIITVDLLADTGNGSVDTVDAYLNFNASALQVVDSAGNPATSLTPNYSGFSGVTYNVVDNVAGRINFSATKFQAPFPTGSVKVATIYFKVNAPTLGSVVHFVQGTDSRARVSTLLQAGLSVPSTVNDATVQVANAQAQYLPLLWR